MAQSIREEDRGIGRYKMWRMIQDAYNPDWMPGRDAFFHIMDRHGLTLKRPKPRHTTNSNHRFRRYKNLTKGLALTHYTIQLQEQIERQQKELELQQKEIEELKAK